MKVSRGLLGKVVVLVWRDPGFCHFKSHAQDGLADVPKGMIALATQEEVGIIEDITEGVVRLRHTMGTDPEHVQDKSVDRTCTWVHEALVERIDIYEKTQTQADDRP